jgi:hypothetical protein
MISIEKGAIVIERPDRLQHVSSWRYGGVRAPMPQR